MSCRTSRPRVRRSASWSTPAPPIRRERFGTAIEDLEASFGKMEVLGKLDSVIWVVVRKFGCDGSEIRPRRAILDQDLAADTLPIRPRRSTDGENRAGRSDHSTRYAMNLLKLRRQKRGIAQAFGGSESLGNAGHPLSHSGLARPLGSTCGRSWRDSGAPILEI